MDPVFASCINDPPGKLTRRIRATHFHHQIGATNCLEFNPQKPKGQRRKTTLFFQNWLRQYFTMNPPLLLLLVGPKLQKAWETIRSREFHKEILLHRLDGIQETKKGYKKIKKFATTSSWATSKRAFPMIERFQTPNANNIKLSDFWKRGKATERRKKLIVFFFVKYCYYYFIWLSSSLLRKS